ncbi:Ankyrin repeats (3 copies) [Legionella donaldsonii]|uniref:Ankyrin repeats (3 copies) n=1 Tax=Legionella donaldsonii TaxID=45060 RepID=A0A378J0I9_9GAMM|nr:ankyrin repeat domain-containing protein [Legionella donaldsonii]STX41095.1 Ankyrin repeats (3 copies) [Legionella donaldsonii]
MPSLPQEILIAKASQWQSRFRGNTADFNEEVTNKGVCLGLSVWRLYCTLTGKYKEYENLLKLIYEADPLADNISPEVHQAFETFIQNTIWLHRTLGIEAGSTQSHMQGALETLFKRKGEAFPLTYHHQLAGVLSEEELKALVSTYLTINPNLQQGVGFTLGCHEHAISITRVGNQIEVVDPAYGKVWSIEIPQKETVEDKAAALKAVVNQMFVELLGSALHFDEAQFQGTYHGVRMHVYSRLHNPTPAVLPTVYPPANELLTPIYEKRKDSLAQQGAHSKDSALDFAIQNGDSKLVLYLEQALGHEKLEACKKHALATAVSYGQFEFVKRYYKKEHVDQNVMVEAYSNGDPQIINFLLEKGHRFEKNAFEYALAESARKDQGYTFNLLMEYYNKFHTEQAALINPAQLATAGKERMPLLNIAAKHSSIEVMRMLLKANVDLSLTDASGRNCLHYLSPQQTKLFVDIATRKPELLLTKDKKGQSPIFRLYKEGKEASEQICALLIKKGDWYEAYILALIHNNQNLIKQCRENIPFSTMLKQGGDSRIGTNRFVELCERTQFEAGRTAPFFQALAGMNYREQTQDTLHDIYLLALKHAHKETISSVLQVPTFDQNALFKKGPIVALHPWPQLTQRPELFDLIASKVDISKLSQDSLIEYYLLALQHKKIDLCKEVSSRIVDKSTLLLKSPRSGTDPYDFFEKDENLFNQIIKPIPIDGLKSEALNQIYKLGLLHNNQAIYSKCIKKLQEDPQFVARTDDLDWCYQKKNRILFKELFAIKAVSEEWCKRTFLTSMNENNYEVAAAILTRFPQLVNTEIDNINGNPQLPLWVAIHKQDAARCQFLLAHDADPYKKRLSVTLMAEGQRREPLKKLFDSHEASIKETQKQFLDVFEQLKEHKQWNLKQKYGFFGDYVNAISLPLGNNKVLHLPRELKETLELIQKACQETSLPLLKGHANKLTLGINALPDKIMPVALKQKLIEAMLPFKVVAPAHREAIQPMRAGPA